MTTLAGLASRRIRLLIYPQTGHGAHWEQPERLTADLAAFLQGRRR